MRRIMVVRLMPSARAVTLIFVTESPAAMCRSSFSARSTGGTA
jgi:hypothetical protein